MRWLIWRDLTVMMRTRAWWIAMAAQTGLLTLLIVVWGDGIPALPGSFFDQFRLIHAAQLVLLLPWVAARCSRESARELALVNAIAASSPRMIVTARWLALCVVTFVTVVSAMPLMAIAMRIGRFDVAMAARSLTIAAALCAFVAALVTTFTITGISRLPAWALVTGLTVLLAALSGQAYAPVLLILALVLTWLSASRAEQRLRYPA